MGLFNNIRRNIVQKLARPEDGFVQAKFYWNEEEDMYVLGMESKTGYYNIPSLSGWKDGWAFSVGLKEIPFSQWIYGVLKNVEDQYCHKLDELSCRYESVPEYDENDPEE